MSKRLNKLLKNRAYIGEYSFGEHVKATLYEDEASIGAFYQRFAEATIDTPETRDQLVVASYYHDSAGPIEFEASKRL